VQWQRRGRVIRVVDDGSDDGAEATTVAVAELPPAPAPPTTSV